MSPFVWSSADGEPRQCLRIQLSFSLPAFLSLFVCSLYLSISLAARRLPGGQGWAGHLARSGTCSTHWRQGRQAGRRQYQRCVGAASLRHHRRPASRRRSLAVHPRVANAGMAPPTPPSHCAALPRSCYSGRVPRRTSSCRSTRALVLTCRRYPQRTFWG